MPSSLPICKNLSFKVKLFGINSSKAYILKTYEPIPPLLSTQTQAIA
jgi:hypothetical protein